MCVDGLLQVLSFTTLSPVSFRRRMDGQWNGLDSMLECGLIGWLFVWLIGRLVGWLVVRLVVLSIIWKRSLLGGNAHCCVDTLCLPAYSRRRFSSNFLLSSNLLNRSNNSTGSALARYMQKVLNGVTQHAAIDQDAHSRLLTGVGGGGGEDGGWGTIRRTLPGRSEYL